MKKLFIISFLFFLAITAFFGISAILSENPDEETVKILITTAAASFYSLIGLSSVVHLGRKFDGLGKAGLVFCGLALFHAIYTTWIDFNGFDVIRNRLSLVLIGLAIGHACLMLLMKPRSSGVNILMATAIGSVVVNTFIAVVSAYSYSFGAIKLIGVIGIIATCATIAAPALNFSIQKQ